MNIFVSLDPKEILDKIGKLEIEKYISKNWDIEDLENMIWENRNVDDLWNSIEKRVESIEKFVVEKVTTTDLLREIEDVDIVFYLKDETEYFVSDDTLELMDQVNNSGCIDEVMELFSLKYSR
ncbi:hypothetical protein [Ilyobacter polytropus]|uniref:Uncharacterized protein n=1 Tax=Ilyobacter polytropus (strain ATCC 51220 / DSM 2926 / LMG 16218 / CuHBu1) TaxID=572544 RepID=E3H9N8_ILYPC|nr:hypothetical protein [Ilyobacter polytropus]ADO83427.1 hypothetical protein Ilyop_1654 [Ilyobacter polytropus DSM 2926]